MRSKSSATKEADRLFSLHVRQAGYCQLAEWFPSIRCNGRHQCCHLISRRYRAVRWLDENARCGCAAHHLYGTHHPLEWEQAAIDAGVDWETLRYRAMHEPPMDPRAVIQRFKEVRL